MDEKCGRLLYTGVRMLVLTISRTMTALKVKNIMKIQLTKVCPYNCSFNYLLFSVMIHVHLSFV